MSPFVGSDLSILWYREVFAVHEKIRDWKSDLVISASLLSAFI
jgi:hypothetical protein